MPIIQECSATMCTTLTLGAVCIDHEVLSLPNARAASTPTRGVVQPSNPGVQSEKPLTVSTSRSISSSVLK
jgi:hypothetical protein